MMSENQACREMTLDEVMGELPHNHTARCELTRLRAAAKAAKTWRDETCWREGGPIPVPNDDPFCDDCMHEAWNLCLALTAPDCRLDAARGQNPQHIRASDSGMEREALPSARTFNESELSREEGE